MEKTVLMSLGDHMMLSPKEMLRALKREGLNIKLPFKAFLNGDKGVIYVGKAVTGA